MTFKLFRRKKNSFKILKKHRKEQNEKKYLNNRKLRKLNSFKNNIRKKKEIGIYQCRLCLKEISCDEYFRKFCFKGAKKGGIYGLCGVCGDRKKKANKDSIRFQGAPPEVYFNLDPDLMRILKNKK
tara:strand:- start:855 stop:1232 length:378 start_codon:yes stop_codon:yes gene_type:complete